MALRPWRKVADASNGTRPLTHLQVSGKAKYLLHHPSFGVNSSLVEEVKTRLFFFFFLKPKTTRKGEAEDRRTEKRVELWPREQEECL